MRASNVIPTCFLALASILPSIHAHDVQSTSSDAETPITISTTTLPAKFFPKYDSKRTKTTYGPYTVPSMHKDNGMMNFGGRIAPPCTDCLITYIHAGLEYPNGTTADADNGMWLHHTVWTNLARNGTTCPHPKRGDRFFASGNERTPVDLTVSGKVKAGYEIQDGDVLAMGGELMNMWADARDVRLSMTFEFVPRVPKAFKKVRSYWLDVAGCGNSDVDAKEDQAFDFRSPAWESQDNGVVVFTASHLHDGGTHTEIRRSGKVVCDSQARYGTCHDETRTEEQHITSLGKCVDVGSTRVGDAWDITAYYNTSKHAPMRHMDGSLEPVMGISLVYVAVDQRGHHGALRILLGVAVAVLTAVLVAMWAKLHGRDWLLRKREGVMLGEDRDAKSQSQWSLLGERYRDDDV